MAVALTCPILVVLSAFDLRQRRIPNRIVLPALVLVLVLQLALSPSRAPEWVLSPLLAALVFVVLSVTVMGLGMGDVKMAMLLGAALGWSVVGAEALALLCALAFAVVLRARWRDADRRDLSIPLAPFLTIGGLFVLAVQGGA